MGEETPSLDNRTTITSSQPPSPSISLKVEFGGGLELLFDNVRTLLVTLPSEVEVDVDGTESSPNLRYLIRWLKDNKLKERPELFVEGETVRPGILVLVNDTDWELEGEEEYILKDGDEIVFISTLHGG